MQLWGSPIQTEQVPIKWGFCISFQSLIVIGSGRAGEMISSAAVDLKGSFLTSSHLYIPEVAQELSGMGEGFIK